MRKIIIYYGRTNAYNSIIFMNETDGKFRVYNENDVYTNEGIDLYASGEDEREELIAKLKEHFAQCVKNDEIDNFYSMEMGEVYNTEDLDGYDLTELVSYEE